MVAVKVLTIARLDDIEERGRTRDQSGKSRLSAISVFMFQGDNYFALYLYCSFLVLGDTSPSIIGRAEDKSLYGDNKGFDDRSFR